MSQINHIRLARTPNRYTISVSHGGFQGIQTCCTTHLSWKLSIHSCLSSLLNTLWRILSSNFLLFLCYKLRSTPICLLHLQPRDSLRSYQGASINQKLYYEILLNWRYFPIINLSVVIYNKFSHWLILTLYLVLISLRTYCPAFYIVTCLLII